MNKRAAHTNSWETAETIFGVALLLGIILGYLFPFPLSVWVPRAASIVIGALLILTGVLLIGMTRRQFRQAGQPTDPGDPTTRLITTGPFAWSRNPLYLSGVIVYSGLAALLNSLWLLILLLPIIAAVHFILIVPEERYLKEKFGDVYHQYSASVRRWVGKRR